VIPPLGIESAHREVLRLCMALVDTCNMHSAARALVPSANAKDLDAPGTRPALF
jgi:hypothetical protein